MFSSCGIYHFGYTPVPELALLEALATDPAPGVGVLEPEAAPTWATVPLVCPRPRPCP